MPVTALYALERRIDVYAAVDVDPSSDRFRTARLASYDDGDTWAPLWVENEVGVFRSSVAGAMTGDSLDTFLVGRGMDNGIYLGRLAEYFDVRTAGWGRIGSGVFEGRPAICVHGTSTTRWTDQGGQATSYAGVGVRVFGRGTDDRFWWASSSNGADSWDMAWDAIGSGTFSSSPAATTSADGSLVAVFGRGRDDRMWWAFSHNGASSWDMAWDAIGSGTFTSAPAACCSADGRRIHVFGRGGDNRIWWATTSRGTDGWDMAWEPIGEGVFTAQPAACCSWDGRVIHVFGRGTDNRIWQARSNDFGASWNVAWRKISDRCFVDTDL
ncbi:hypothetical protein [Agromyces larvae]|uniref:Exo-alpha-sialidase n=1 Tax=Agromyces larvae TaxID=2929802 RepID=A0ABY4BW14_9MICO|nr:hypothetical protein [Agromyces larvae]UOE43387.1 hypothetical protein MTO99_14515 [Agromyces larvae]